MRHIIQFLVPALIVVAVVYMATRRRRQAVVEGRGSEIGMLVFIIVTGALVAVSVMFGLGNYLE